MDVKNNFDIENVYEILCNSKHIRSEKYITIEPKGSQKVKFEYKPIHVESQKEKIGFISNHSEPVWYQLEVQAEQPPAVKLPVITAEIGKEKEHVLTFKNPMNKKNIRFSSKWIRAQKGEDLWVKRGDNEEKTAHDQRTPKNKKWNIIPSSFEIGSKKTKKIRLVYLPDDIEKQDRIGIRFYSEDLGLFEYECYGKGCLPTTASMFFLQAPLNDAFGFTIPFKNPFSDTIQVFFKLEQANSEQNKFRFKFPEKFHMTIAAFGKIEIPLIFRSTSFGKFQCTLILSIRENLKWVFPIEMETECNMTTTWSMGKVITRSHQPIQQKLGFFLQDLVDPTNMSIVRASQDILNPKNVFNQLARSKIEFDEVTNASINKGEMKEQNNINSKSIRSRVRSNQEEENLNIPNFRRLSKTKKNSFIKAGKDLTFSKYDSIISFIKNPNEIQNIDSNSKGEG